MKSTLLILIISSFVFVGCTIDTKQKYSVMPAGAEPNEFYVYNNETGEVKICVWDGFESMGKIGDVYLACSDTYNTTKIEGTVVFDGFK